MNVKNLNPLERHVEKIVLAVAALGAAYIGYLAVQPILIPGTDIKPAEVEATVSEALAHLDEAREEVKRMGDIKPVLHNYLEDYLRNVDKQPLREGIATAAVPEFAPKNVPVERAGGTSPSGSTYQIVTPSAPAPIDVAAVADHYVVTDTPPTPPGAEAPAAPPIPTSPPRDTTMVEISGRIPIANFRAQMSDPSLKPNQKLPAERQVVYIYRIEVERRERINEVWSAWSDPLPPSRSGGDPPTVDWTHVSDIDLVNVLNNLDASFKKIVEPDYYLLASGQPFNHKVLSAPAPTGPRPPGAPATPGRPGTPGAAVDEEGNVVNPNNPNIPGVPGDVVQIKAQDTIPFWFYDETAQPLHEYQYRVRVVLYNPTYRLTWGLKDPAMETTPTLLSEWTPIQTPVPVPSDTYFFITRGLGANSKSVSVDLFKWSQDHWYSKPLNVEAGNAIVGKVDFPRNTPPGSEIVDTHYTLVDVVEIGHDVNAILLTPTGELIARDANADKDNPVRREILSKMEKDRPAPPPPPAGATTPPPTAPVPPRTGQTGRGRMDAGE